MYIGDVSGHGVPAAMLTVFLNQSIKTTKELGENRFEVISPSDVLKDLYELYSKVNFRDDVYILVLYAIFDLETKELTYSSAGLNTLPILIKKNNVASEINIRGLPICNLKDIIEAGYWNHTIQLEEGDRVFFYTDGLVELKNRKTGDSITEERLKEFLTENNDKSSPEVFEELDSLIESVSNGSEMKDDVTFFMMQVNGE